MDKIEEKFYKIFGIKPQKLCFNGDCAVKDEIGYDERICDDSCVYIEREYPKITDHKLLKLICILNDFEGINVKGTTIKELKEELLKQCIEPFEYPIAFEEHHEIDKLYHKVQSLFKGGE